MRTLEVAVERWPIAGTFTISRGSRTEAAVVVATISEGPHRGRGECVPYARYGETIEGVVRAIEGQREAIAAGLTTSELQKRLPGGAARNALDCALWDLAAHRSGRRAWELAGTPEPVAATTAFTLSLGTPESMAEAADAARARPLLKVKLGGAGDAARIAAVRRAAPDATLIVDANEAWRAELLAENLAACEAAGVALIEQPLPAGEDAALAGLRSAIPICADESFHGRESFAGLAGRYQAINIKLDKTGGLTDALAVAAEARSHGLAVMVGCMVGTSLAMAPAFLLTPFAQFVDLDGPLLLARDRQPGIRFEGSTMVPFGPEVWG
jgi:L-alanine-DL-glutamate epimerase-like enolase superfamily enzyme